MKKFLILKNKMLFPMMSETTMRNSKTHEIALEVETDDLVDTLPEGFNAVSRPVPNKNNQEAFLERIKNMKTNRPDFINMIKNRQPKK